MICRQQLHEIALRLVTALQIIEIGSMLRGFANILPNESHPSD
jgi:hypothetical protein